MVSALTQDRVRGWDGSSLGIGTLEGADPLGFAAGDTNLYRYVGNSPTDASDPTGLATDQPTPAASMASAGPSVTDYPNTPSGGTVDYFINYWTTFSNYRERVMRYYRDSRVPSVTDHPNTLDIDDRTRIGAGHGGFVSNIPEGHYVGTDGAASCIGVIVTTPPDANGRVNVWAYHIQGGERADLPDYYHIPPGSHVVVFGGNNDYGSNETLSYVMNWIYWVNNHGNGLLTAHENFDPSRDHLWFDGYTNRSGLYVDRYGHYHAFEGCGPNANYRENLDRH